MEFSVLMSVYYKEKSKYLDKALESVLIKQSVIPNEVVLVKDGLLTEELENVINKYKIMFRKKFNIIKLEKNMGLGKALEIGLKHCKYKYVARVDTDDINDYYRFELQLEMFSKNSNIDLVGSNIAEFFNSPDDIKFIREVPIDINNIKKMSKRRNPINHMTVMFRKKSVINAGSYKHLPYLEDYFLWVRMINKGYKLKNINDNLVYARTGESMFQRRSNFEYIKSWYKLQKYMYNVNMTNIFDFLINMVNIIFFIIIPPKLKKIIYSMFLRK
ncbi:glycosyltransferase [Halanaerobium congolense]|uniref:Glycosyl transferase family 2 n=1 Tax=Halanaerobium congolense TaxID=54121 RepID=A0A4R7E4S8_9FIRM|nr:glycosyltransferase [Halanaerobium congolense]TDS28054.1 glycosyl transferase family 2 [Halanaerobium congolense]SDH60190.1 Glycosyl transferase family 2 [Halanaerobium congolense]